jgi:integrase
LHIEPKLGQKPIDELTRGTIKKFIDDLKQATWKDKDGNSKPFARDTVRIIYSTLRKIFVEAVDDKLIVSNPASNLRPRFRELHRVHEINPFSEEEITQFMEEAIESCPYWFGYFACLFYTGLRPGEGIALKWNDVDFGRRVLNIHATG